MNRNQPLVSVIVPAYNHQAFVEESIEALIQQDYMHLEFIIIDDGSTDQTVEIIERLMPACRERFSHVIFRSRPNEGVVRTLNEAIGLAQGKYIAAIASDDVFEPDAIRCYVDFMEENPGYVLVVGDNLIIDDESEVCCWDKQCENTHNANEVKYDTFGSYLQHKRRDVDFLSESFGSYESLLRGNYVPNGYLMRRDVIQSFYYSESAQIEDHHIMLQLAKHGKLKYLDRVMCRYRWHASNTIKSMDDMAEKALVNLDLEKDYCFDDPELRAIWLKQRDVLLPRRGLRKLWFKLVRSMRKRIKRSG